MFYVSCEVVDVQLDLIPMPANRLLTILKQEFSASTFSFVFLQSAFAPFVHEAQLRRRPLAGTRWPWRVDEHQSVRPALLETGLESIVFKPFALALIVPEVDVTVYRVAFDLVFLHLRTGTS